MEQAETLYILWTTRDILTARNMVFMYAGNCLRRGWWPQVHMIVWGAATELLATDPDVRGDMHDFLELGGEVSVCRLCAENLGRVREVEATNFTGKYSLRYTGEFLTQVLKSGAKLITI